MPLGTARPPKLQQPPSTLINLGPPSPAGSTSSRTRHTSSSHTDEQQEEEFELVRSYEYGHGPTLPTSHLTMSSANTASPDAAPRRFAAGGFDPYQGRTPAELGEDKVQEKGVGATQQAYAKAGLQPVVNPNANAALGGVAIKGRYESLIPEKRPPRTPVSSI